MVEQGGSHLFGLSLLIFYNEVKMLDDETIKKINQLVDEGKFVINQHAQADILKQGYNWSKDFIKDCLHHGKKYMGNELYPDKKERHDRLYCIHKESIFSLKLVLICFKIYNELVVIHMQPLNKGSIEGKIYYSS